MNITNIFYMVCFIALFICIGLCKTKNAPVDVVLFVCSFFTGVFFLLSNINSIYHSTEFWYLFYPFIVFIVAPLVYSFYFQRVNKEAEL